MGNRGRSHSITNPSKSEDSGSEKKPLLSSPKDAPQKPEKSATEDVYSLDDDAKASLDPEKTEAADVYTLEDDKSDTKASFETPPAPQPPSPVPSERPSLPSREPKPAEKPSQRPSTPFFPFPVKKDLRPRLPKSNPLIPSGNHRKSMAQRRSNAGKVAAMCVGETIDIDDAHRFYKASGYVTSIRDNVLHVTNCKGYRSGGTPQPPPSRRQQLTSLLNYTFFSDVQGSERFDLFIFECGSIVWWGVDMECYRRVVERPFFYSQQKTKRVSAILTKIGVAERLRQMITPLLGENPTRSSVKRGETPNIDFVQQRYGQQTIEALFPMWLNFSVGLGQGDGAENTPGKDDELFLQGLQNDHILLLSELPAHKEAISHAIAQSVKLDVLEPMVDDLLALSRPLPKQLSTNGFARITSNCVNRSKGELFLCRMNLRDLLDEPDYFWDFPWFYRYYGILRTDYSVEQRVECLEEKLSAVQEILDMLGDQFTQEHNTRLEWIIIWLIIAAVVIAGVELYTQVMRLRGRNAEVVRLS